MDGTREPDNRSVEGGQNQPQPGATIMPGAAVPPTASTPDTSAQTVPELPAVQGSVPGPVAPVLPGTAAMSQVPPASPQPAAAPSPSPLEATPAPSGESSFTAGSLAMDNSGGGGEPQVAEPGTTVSWTASEFIAHNKSVEWYGVLLGAALLGAAALWLLTKDLFSSIVIVVAVGILAAYAARQPRELHYAIHDQGVMVGSKRYPFNAFRSFSIVREAGSPFSSIEFIPLKRLALPLTIYYDPADESKIADAIAAHVPYEERERDPIDALMHRIHF